LQQLASDEGFDTSVNGKSTLIHGILGLFSPDSWECSLFGFSESFSAKSLCRFSLVHKGEIQVKFLAFDFEKQTHQHVDLCAAHMIDANYSASSTWIE
jgi:hypothetical protein